MELGPLYCESIVSHIGRSERLMILRVCIGKSSSPGQYDRCHRVPFVLTQFSQIHKIQKPALGEGLRAFKMGQYYKFNSKEIQEIQGEK
jgi:hypothetical protein